MIVQAIPVGQATATPVSNSNPEPIYAYANPEQMAQDINDVLDDFSDEIPSVQDVVKQEQEKKARKKISDFMDYIKSDKFKNDVKDTAGKYKIPEREVAQTFISKVLGTIGDICGIVIGTVRNTVHTVVDLLSAILNGAVDIICNVASALTRVVTLNKTNVKC